MKTIEYGLKNDRVFRIVFGDLVNKEKLKSLLEAFLRIKISTITIRNPMITGDTLGERFTILDTLVEIDNGVKINVEMQVVNIQNTERRFLAHWARTFVSGLRKGDKTYLMANKTIVICLLDYELDYTRKYHSIFRAIEETDLSVRFEDLMEIHTIELPKFEREKFEGMEEYHDEIQWLKLINSDKNIEELETESTKEIVDAVRKVNKNSYYLEQIDAGIEQEKSIQRLIEKKEQAEKEKEQMQKEKEQMQKEKEQMQKEKEQMQKEKEALEQKILKLEREFKKNEI